MQNKIIKGLVAGAILFISTNVSAQVAAEEKKDCKIKCLTHPDSDCTSDVKSKFVLPYTIAEDIKKGTKYLTDESGNVVVPVDGKYIELKGKEALKAMADVITISPLEFKSLTDKVLSIDALTAEKIKGNYKILYPKRVRVE